MCLLLRALLGLSLVKEVKEVLYVPNRLVRAHQLLAPLLVLCLAPAALIVCISGLLRLSTTALLALLGPGARVHACHSRNMCH